MCIGCEKEVHQNLALRFYLYMHILAMYVHSIYFIRVYGKCVFVRNSLPTARAHTRYVFVFVDYMALFLSFSLSGFDSTSFCATLVSAIIFYYKLFIILELFS